MILHVPNVLNGEQVARCREVMTCNYLGGWPRHRRPPIRPRQEQPPASREEPRVSGAR
jgi:hypothetical protein